MDKKGAGYTWTMGHHRGVLSPVLELIYIADTFKQTDQELANIEPPKAKRPIERVTAEIFSYADDVNTLHLQRQIHHQESVRNTDQILE